MRQGDERAGVERMDDAAVAQKGQQVQSAHTHALRVVVQRRIGVCAHMRRHRDGADIDRAGVRQRGCPLLGVRRVTGKDRAVRVNRR